MNKKQLTILGICVAVVAVLAFTFMKPARQESFDRADSDIAWQYKTAAEVKEMLESGADAIYLDIRQPESYNAGHLPGTLVAHAFPVDTPELENALRDVKDSFAGEGPIIVICERGKKGAQRTISVLADEGIPAERFYILEGGAAGWPYPEMLVTED